MLETLQGWTEGLRTRVPQALDGEALSALLAVSAALAGFLLAGAAIWLLRCYSPVRAGSRLRIIGRRLRDPFRLVCALTALALAAPWIADDTRASAVAARLAGLSAIALVGWALLAALNAYADLAERRYRLDVEDNLLARKHHTQFQVLRRAGQLCVVTATIAAMLMTVPAVRDYGVSLFASAGVAGIVFGLAARPVLSNLIAGVQIALTQPIRIEDAVVVEGEWGWIEEITATYVVIRVWDWRRMIVPLAYFIEKPFQNWTRETATIMGSVFWRLDYTAPVQRIREKLQEVAEGSELWDGRVVNLQVVDAGAETIELRALVSARNSPRAWDLRCEVRERILAWLQDEYPEALPRTRAEFVRRGDPASAPQAEPERQPVGPERENPPAWMDGAGAARPDAR
jgi:small-conductance mechanosensitive channel